MDRGKLKGGLETRRGGKLYDQYDETKKSCGCKMGEKCACNNDLAKKPVK